MRKSCSKMELSRDLIGRFEVPFCPICSVAKISDTSTHNIVFIAMPNLIVESASYFIVENFRNGLL